MRQTLRLAARGAASCMPNPRVGCVIVRRGRVVGRGSHMIAGGPHAEVIALNEAGRLAEGADVYITLEPCVHTGRTPPCVDALREAKPARVVFACEDPDPRVAGRSRERLRRAGIACESGLLEEEARWINRGFFSRHQRGRPWIVLKTASGLDGRIALADGSSRWITSPQARRDVHRLRARSCAIMTGSGTALHDDPQLTARGVGAKRQPLRVLVDGEGRCPEDLRLFDGPSLVATRRGNSRRYPASVAKLVLPSKRGKIDLSALLGRLADRRQINTVLVEAGSGLAGALLAAGLVDEIVAYIAPRYLGEGPATAAIAGGFPLDGPAGFKLRSMRRIGPDCRLDLVRENRA